MTTEELLKKCVKGERAAWDKFARLYESLVIRSVRYKLRNLGLCLAKSEVMDIVQETFLLIWEKDKLSRVKKADSLRSWLAVVSINVTTNYCKKHIFGKGGKELSLEEACSGNEDGLAFEDILPDETRDPDKTLEYREMNAIIRKEILSLRAKERLAIKFNLYDGKTQKDIGRIMNISENTVASLIMRAKKQLRSKLTNSLKS